MCPVVQDQVPLLPLLPELATISQHVIASPNVGPTANVSPYIPSGAAITFSAAGPSAVFCTGSRPMHVEYVSHTGAHDRCPLCDFSHIQRNQRLPLRTVN
jgi:hypothetical protein